MKRYLLHFTILFLFFKGFSQTTASSFLELKIDGVSFSKKTNVIFEDKLGFLWLGTNNGLYRYDGHSLNENVFNVFDENSIPNNNINSIIEDDFGNLWLGSESYLIVYNRKQNIFKGFYKNKSSKILGKSANGTIWAFVQKVGLIKIKSNNKIEAVTLDSNINYKKNNAENQIAGATIYSYLQDDFGRNWFTSSKGVFILDESETIINSSLNDILLTLNKGKNNTLIASTENEIKVLKYFKNTTDLKILETYNSSHFFKNENITYNINSCSTENKGDVIWVGTNNGLLKGEIGINGYQFSLFKTYLQKKQNLSNQINASLIDRYNNLWVGTQKGVNKLIGKANIFQEVSINTDLANVFATSILPENKNQILVGFRNKGLYRYNFKNKTAKNLFNATGEVSFLKIDSRNKLLFLAAGNKLLKAENYSPKNSEITLDTIKKYSHPIKDVLIVNESSIWVGMWSKGIDIVVNREKTLFEKKVISTLANNNVFVMHLDKKQNIWIGTRGEGLFKVNIKNETIKHFTPSLKNGLSSNAILCIKETKDGNICIGTRGGGLNIYGETKTDQIKIYNKNNGLLSGTICSIEEDKKGNLWLSTLAGISHLDLSTQKIKNFAADEGVNHRQFTFNVQSSFQDHLFFGCLGGFYIVNTNNFKETSLLANTVITDFSIFGNAVNDSLIQKNNAIIKHKLRNNEAVELPHNQNNLVIKFSSLDFTSPSKNKFAYKLEGVNDFWLNTDATNRNANYNNLAPGTYTFKVKSTNSDGVWNDKPAQLTFAITPPIWKSNTAFLFYAILGVFSIWLAWYLIKNWYRLKKTLVAETVSREKDKELHKMKMTFFTDVSHELRTPLALIQGTIEKVVKEKKFELNPMSSQRIYNNTLRMQRLINQMLDIRKFDEGKLKLNISKNDILTDIKIIKNAFNDFAKIYEIKYELNTSLTEANGWYDVDILEKILFNLLSNAFKYTKEKGEITLNVELIKEFNSKKEFGKLQKGKYIKCLVRDNGVGIPEKDLDRIFDRYYQATKTYTNQIPGTGIGMELVQKLVERHHGFISVASVENVFTEFVFYLPLDKNKYRKSELLEKGMPLKKNFIKKSEYQVIEEVSSEFDAKSKAKNSNKPKILIVEDNPDLRQMLKEELSNSYYIIEAENGQVGYNMVLKEKPQLVISDVLMPIEDGISMLKRLKNNVEVNNIPVFMLTAKTANETKIECVSLGAEDYIEKPFSLEFVKWKVKNALVTRKILKEKFSKVITAKPSEVQIESRDEKFVKKLIKIIEDNIDDNLLSVEFLALEVGMSRANLYRKLQVIVNDTPVNFIKKIKLKRAAQLLERGDLYISEIAYMTGFNNQKYFSKCFSKEYNMNPTQYVKKYASSKSSNSIQDL